mmetsp:Transcript_39589/g.125893  ORF Transcript_39589/g.125893 Transcript_39589/m.125893 type:complete len:220 (+) Transcript_39589:1923-2582(+)
MLAASGSVRGRSSSAARSVASWSSARDSPSGSPPGRLPAAPGMTPSPRETSSRLPSAAAMRTTPPVAAWSVRFRPSCTLASRARLPSTTRTTDCAGSKPSRSSSPSASSAPPRRPSCSGTWPDRNCGANAQLSNAFNCQGSWQKMSSSWGNGDGSSSSSSALSEPCSNNRSASMRTSASQPGGRKGFSPIAISTTVAAKVTQAGAETASCEASSCDWRG